MFLPIREADPVAVYHAIADGPGYILEFPGLPAMIGIGSRVKALAGDPFDALRAMAADPPFSPAGYCGYEGGGRFLSAGFALSVDPNGITLFPRIPNDEAKSRIQGMAELLLSRDLSYSAPQVGDLPKDQRTTMERSRFTDGVKQLKSHIVDGDCYQAVLSRKIHLPFKGDPLRIYSALRSRNPSCYGYFLDFGDEQVVGESPEMLVAASGSALTTVPIAGTRPRGGDSVEDDALAADLLADKKERSEHLMLVDLARNDIGRVAAYGTVAVSRYAEVAKYRKVQHIISIVTAEAAPGYDGYDALRSCFPAGTVTGAPKKRAMELVDELEREPRGIYAGAVGYAGRSSLSFAIAIRTVVVRNGLATVQAGAGIVAGSDPDREFDETAIKAEACLRAISAAGKESA